MPCGPGDGTMRSVRNVRRAGLVAGALCAALGCSGNTRPGAVGAGDAAVGVGGNDAGACMLSPVVDLDHAGVSTPEGDAAWIDFSTSSDQPQLTPIANCGGPVYNAILLRWTAPTAGILRLRVDRDQADWAQEQLGTAYLTARRLDGCVWDSPSHDCSVATFENDPQHTRSDFEFHVAAGTQTLALAWSFNDGGAGVRTTNVPALRVSAKMILSTGYGAACTVPPANRDSLCPARSDCLAAGGADAGTATTCVPRGAQGGICRGPLSDCDAPLACVLTTSRCGPSAGPGESCELRGCAAGSTCVVHTPVSDSRCIANGGLFAACRAASDPAGACDAPLTCRTLGRQTLCVQETALGAPCDAQAICAGASVCAPDATGHSVCQAAGAEGTPCGVVATTSEVLAFTKTCVWEGVCRVWAPRARACVCVRHADTRPHTTAPAEPHAWPVQVHARTRTRTRTRARTHTHTHTHRPGTAAGSRAGGRAWRGSGSAGSPQARGHARRRAPRPRRTRR